jgi:DNA-binding NtrC family response regulator
LQNVIERAVILSGDCAQLEPEHLGLGAPAHLDPEVVIPNTPGPTRAAAPAPEDFPTLAELEKQHILAALSRCKGNRTHAAKVLEISIRTLRNKLHEYNGDVEHAELAGDV